AKTTNTITATNIIEVGANQNLPIWATYNASNTVAGVIQFTFSGSWDGTNWISARTNLLVFNSITANLGNTNATTFNCGAFRWLKINTIENTNTFSISNITVGYYSSP